MRTKESPKFPPASAEPLVAREMPQAAPPLKVNVRTAKDQLSSLLEEAARGNEVIITSDGQPKAKLIPVRGRKPLFKMDWELLRSMPKEQGAVRAEDLIRKDRDGRA